MKTEVNIEDVLTGEAAAWEATRREAGVSLESLRSRARALSPEQKQRIENEVAELFPVKVSTPKNRRIRVWRQMAAGLAAVLVLMTFAPAMARNAMDLPGIGMLIKQFTMRHAGLDWAFENGYVQGTMAEASKDGVTVKILGYLADPVHTTVIYVIQGVDRQELDHNLVPVTIRSVQGEETFSWGGEYTATALGYVGTVHTWAIPDQDAILHIHIGLPGEDSMSIRLPVTREAVSRLATVSEVGREYSLHGVTVAVDKVTLTPAQLMVEYRIQGQGQQAGGLWGQETFHLRGSGLRVEPRAGSGGTFQSETETWHLRAIFDRPDDIQGLEFVIPVLAQQIDVAMQWSLTQQTAVAESGGISLTIYDIAVSEGNVHFKYDYQEAVQNLRDFTVVYADGSFEHISHPTMSWSYLEWTGVQLPVKPGAVPVAVRADAVSVPLHGPWVLPLTTH